MLELADVLQDMERSEQSLEWLNHVDRSKGFVDDQSKTLRARAHYKLGEMPQAHELYAELFRSQPREWHHAYMASNTAPDIAQRERFMRDAEKAAPANGVVQVGLANVLGAKGDRLGQAACLRKAQAMLEAEAEAFPARTWVYQWLEMVCSALGEDAKAVRYRGLAEQSRSSDGKFEIEHLVGVEKLILR
jgi:predicted Zn-dependent protease